jgi:hypothetical protein
MPELKNLRREKFAHLIVQGMPATKAYVEAGFTAKNERTAEACSSRLLSSDIVKDRIAELRAPVMQQLQLTTTAILDRLVAIGMADVGDLMKWDKKGVRVVDSKTLSQQQRAAISEVKVLGDGTVAIKLRDPVPALRLLGHHMGLFSGEVSAPVAGDTTVINNDNRTVVYVDRPPDETAEQWEARQRTRLGVDEPVRRRAVDATNGSAKRGH